MKKFVIPVLAGLGLVCGFITADQEYSETVKREFTLQKDGSETMLVIWNVFGSIKVEGYTGDKVLCTVKKTISGDSQEDIEKGKTEVKLEFDQNADSIIAYTSEPFDSRPGRKDNIRNNRNIDYEYRLDFTIKVPSDMHLDISTVLSGDIEIKNVEGSLDAGHVNGAISMENIKGITTANTVNGDININYSSNPPGESTYHTINGNIRVYYMPDLSADMEFKSMMGEFYTDFPEAKLLPPGVKKSQSGDENKGTLYKIEKVTNIRFGNGGMLFRFETLNGNVYIKKQS